MKKEEKITYEFIRYIHQAMIHEKIKYSQKSDIKRREKNGIKIIQDGNITANLDTSHNKKKEFMPIYSYEELEKKMDYENLEKYIDDTDLANSIGNLTNKEKLILYMKYVEGKKDTTISREFGISSQAVSKRKRNILKKIKEQVKKE